MSSCFVQTNNLSLNYFHSLSPMTKLLHSDQSCSEQKQKVLIADYYQHHIYKLYTVGNGPQMQL